MTGPSTQRQGHVRAGMCQLRAPLPVLWRAARELFGNVGGGYRVCAVAVQPVSPTLKGKKRRTIQEATLRAPHIIRNEPRIRYRNRP